MNNIIRIENTFKKFMKEDYDNLFSFLNENNIYPKEHHEQIKKDLFEVHRYIYSLCLWSNEFETSPINQNIYLIQIRSDAIQSLYLSLIGFKKPVKLLLRGIIEDLLEHLYYYDHKIEYERVETETKYYQDIRDLWEYLKNHPRIKHIVNETEIYGVLRQYYSELSKYVHSSTSKHMDYINTIDNVKFDVDFFKEYKKDIINISCCVNYLLYVFYNVSVGHESELFNHIINFIPDQFKQSLKSM